MPNNALQTAAAARLEPVEGIVVDSEPLARQLAISPNSFRQLSDLIASELGIKTSTSKLPMIQNRLLCHVRRLGLSSIDEYCHLLFSAAGQSELPAFFDSITTNKTDFFREPEHFDILRQRVLPALDPSRGMAGQERVKVWSAACSSGNEPYTLAMVLAEHGLAFPGFEFSVLGTDISTRVLETARQAIYPVDQIEPVPRDLRWRFLQRGSRPETRGYVRVVASLRERVRFERLNLMARDYRVPSDFDVIFCRNVLIYFERTTQQQVIEKLCRHLRPGGFLFVGHSESLAGLELPLEQVRATLYRRTPVYGVQR